MAVAQVAYEGSQKVEIEPKRKRRSAIDLPVLLQAANVFEVKCLPIKGCVMGVDGNTEVAQARHLDRIEEHHPDQSQEDRQSRLLIVRMDGQPGDFRQIVPRTA